MSLGPLYEEEHSSKDGLPFRVEEVFCFLFSDAVCFDVDSTVIREEGIDKLAKICGVEDAVSQVTK